ncbi:MAG: 1-acyl-sn-glycerol-3-phosphate acyltransferase [Frankiaceae bacterium]|jgi:1-acyl-sn-glycerol-3-phosphate acyltransferase|nr:1-acyl-sn-glycerol-3-phosphate acyltransferase [Frankiaceae bacterium]
MAAHQGGPWWRIDRPGAGGGIKVSVATLYPLSLLVFRRDWRRIERVPAHGPAIVVMNHVSRLDPVLMATMLWDTGRVPRFMIKSSLFDKPVIGWVFRTAEQIPVARGTGDARASVDAAHQALRNGEMVAIYPEGTTTRDPAGWPMQARTGIARLALDNPGVPVIPIGHWGLRVRAAGRAPRRLRLRRIPVAASVGPPVELEDLRARPMTLDVLRQVTARIMTAVRDEVAAVRGEDPPEQFYVPPRQKRPRPPAAGPAGAGDGAG